MVYSMVRPCYLQDGEPVAMASQNGTRSRRGGIGTMKYM